MGVGQRGSRVPGRIALLLVAAVIVSFGVTAVPSNAATPAGQRFVPSVLGAFNGLSKRPDALAIGRPISRAGTTCKHYQGVVRVNGPDGTPYLIMTKSGNDPDGLAPCFQDDEPGWLIVAEMGSRTKSGERLGPNFLPYGSTSHSVFPEPLATFAQDRVVWAAPLDGVERDGDPAFPSYRHPGGMQVLGDVLAIGAEVPFNGETSRATIIFVDISNPAHPRFLSRFDPPDLGPEISTATALVFDQLDPNGELNWAAGADPVALTAGKTAAGTRYVLAAAGSFGNKQLRFYRSGLVTKLDDLKAANFWTEVGRFSRADLNSCLGATWPTSGVAVPGGQHQMFNFVRQDDLDGPLYLLAGRRDGLIVNPFADEYLDLYEVHLSAEALPEPCPLTHVASKTMDIDAWGNEGTVSTFSAASGVYVSPSGELIVYSGKHDATITDFLGIPLSDHIAVGEYRIGSLVRANSPTLRPTATVDGPVAVDEGSSVPLTGHGEPAITKAFIQLFEDDDVGLELPGLLEDDEWLTVEYGDRSLDRFDSLDLLGGDASEIWDNAGSWRWFAPVGCTISANDYPIRSDEWPGPSTVLLRGTGRFEEALDLDALSAYKPAEPDPAHPWRLSPAPGDPPLTVDYDDDVEGITFFHSVLHTDGDGSTVVAREHDCDAYYNAPIGLGWDLDGNGSFETSGTTATFSAATLDGPSTASVRARAQHPTDTTPLGTGAPLPVSIEIRNVAPQIASATVVDSLGRSLSGGTNVALVGLPVKLAVDFTDPGKADTQTGHVSWGDGSSSTAFDTFSGATGGVTGHLRHSHIFTSAGTFTIASTISDDDGGATTVEQTITVLSLEGAIQQVADELTQRIGQTTNPGVIAALRAARDELLGNHGGKPPTNGALDKLQANDPSGAIVKVRAAIMQLISAESRGAGDLSSLKDLLGLVAEGIATGAYEQARIRIGAPSSGQTRTLATIAAFIAQGHQQLSDRQYANACDTFRQATDKAVSLR
jgi:hypothetical protein